MAKTKNTGAAKAALHAAGAKTPDVTPSDVAKPDIKKECDYTVGDGDVTLVVTIGNGNPGTIDVFLDGDEIEPVPGTNTWNLGPGTDLDQKTLEIDSGVTPLHDIIVTAELAGGPQKGTCIAKGSTTHNPATVQILIDFSAE